MPSERLTVDISEEEQKSLIEEYVRKHMTEATNELITEDFGEVTTENFYEVAASAMVNEMIINILQAQIDSATQVLTKEVD